MLALASCALSTKLFLAAYFSAGATQGDLTKGKIKHGKDSLTLGNDERSVRPLNKVSTRKKGRYSDPDCA